MSDLEVVTIHRSQPMDDVEVDAKGRTIFARLMRYNVVNRVSDDGITFYNERWKFGVFAQTIQRTAQKGQRFPLFTRHPRGQGSDLPIGVTMSIEERADGPYMTGKVSRTQAGDEVLELVRDGALPGVSVGARVVRSSREGGIVDRLEAAINEVTLTPFAALAGADILALREKVDDEPQPLARPALDELDAWLRSLRRP
jgi:hypothetical protein